MTSTLIAPPAANPRVPVAGPMLVTLENQGVFLGHGHAGHPCCFLFPGHGSQYPNMLKHLRDSSPVVRETFDTADAIYRELTGTTLSALLFCDDPAEEERVRENLARPEVMQPVIYLASMALFRLVSQAGVRPDLLLGHSLGEFAALTAAGVLSFEDGLRAVYARGACVGAIEPAKRGGMIAIQHQGDPDQIDRMLIGVQGYWVRSIINSPGQVIYSGESAALNGIAAVCARQGVNSKILPVTHGFHSALLRPAAAAFEAQLRTFAWHEPEIPVLSSALGAVYDRESFRRITQILASQLTTPFNFQRLVTMAYDRGIRTFVEVGPRNILCGLVREILAGSDGVAAVHTNHPSTGDAESWERFLAFAHVHGLGQQNPAQPKEEEPALKSTERNDLVPPPQPTAGGEPSALQQELCRLVHRKTAYPLALLASDLPMVTRLGITPVIYREILGEIEHKYGMAQGALSGDDLTIAQIARVIAPPAPAAATAVQPQVTAVSREAIQAALLAAIAEKTGYPAEMVEPHLDLEADLGIDSVKQAEIFRQVREGYSLDLPADVKLKELNTVGKLTDYFASLMAQTGPQAAPAPAAEAPALERAEVTESLLRLIQEKTGYPPEMLEPHLDLEADLGIDSVKQAEILGQVRSHYGLAKAENASLKELNTIARIVDYLMTLSPEGSPPAAPEASDPFRPLLEHAGEGVTNRYIPVTAAQAYPEAVDNPFALAGKAVLLIADPGGQVASPLTQLLTEAGASVAAVCPPGLTIAGARQFPVDFGADAAAIEASLTDARRQTGPVSVIINLYPLAEGPAFADVPTAEWEAEVDRQFHANFFPTRCCYGDLENPTGGQGGYFAATAIGGAFGFEATAGQNPLGGITTGFAKSVKKELPHLAVKVVDFPDLGAPADLAAMLLKEIRFVEERTEIAYTAAGRKVIQVLPAPLALDRHAHPLPIGPESVILITGGGRGITFECARGLAELCNPVIVMTGRTPLPTGDEEWMRMNDEELKQYRAQFLVATRKANPGLTPMMLEQEFNKLLSARELYGHFEALKARGMRIYYEVCDVADGAQVRALVDRVKERFGRIDGVVHGAGLRSIGRVAKKPVAHTQNLVRVKTNGFFHLWRATAGEPLKFFVTFGSISGRFGMDGQVDYTAASDVVSKCSYLIQRSRPDLLCTTIDWTAWAETGMASDETVRQVQQGQRGLAYVDVAEGVNKFLAELCYGGDSPEVMFFGELGLNNPYGQLDGLDEKRQAVATPIRPDGTVVDRITYPLLEKVLDYRPDATVIAAKDLHPSEDLHLAEHIVQGVPTLAGVMQIEAHCEAAALLSPGFVPGHLENVEFSKFVKHFPRNPLTIQVAAEVIAETDRERVVRATVKSDFVNASGHVLEKERLHSAATYTLLRERPTPAPMPADVPRLFAQARMVDLDKFYTGTAEGIFFGPTFRLLDQAGYLSDREIIGKLHVATGHGLLASLATPRFLTAPVLLDAAGRVILVWEYERNGDICVPVRIGAGTLHRPVQPGETIYAWARFNHEDDGLLHFELDLIDAANRPVIQLHDLTLIRLSIGKEGAAGR